VIYNRKDSAIALAARDEFDWDEIFSDATWFHFSGITPAISDSMAEITLDACKKAKEKGLTVSCDLNYRSKLWSSEKANRVMSEICPYVDICIANEDDAVGIFSMDASNTSEEKNAYIARELMKMFPFRLVASVWRTETSITTFKLQSMVYTEGKAYYSKEYYMNILDYIGAGDAYCAGIIYSILNGFDPQRMVEFSNAASCLKHTVSGDYNLVTADEVMKLAFGNAGNEVQR
jgi:2-dehydro-3-deoxygluconokinase